MSPRPIVLLAASGLAREVLAALAATDRPVVAILDDDPTLHGTTVAGIRVDGPIRSAAERPDTDFVICAGSGRARRAIAANLAQQQVRPERFATIVHPTASIGSTCVVGPGAVVLSGVSVTADVSIGAHAVVMPNAVITHDCFIDQFVTICAGTALGGNVRVAEGAYLGMNSSVRQRLTVGRWSVLGMSSALLTDLPAEATWVGIPAGPIQTASRTGPSGKRDLDHQVTTNSNAVVMEKK